ncbi:cytochrome c [Seohaeicola saemankumensis]|nr:cytochrome c [Seohaeicola saemankumensis]MCA0872630.1 cytochrome c [Seohaeicola saemankumensis]
MALTVLLALTASAQQTERVEDPDVQRRMDTMNAAKAALVPLAQMMAGRIRFDRSIAADARKRLIRATRSIPGRFRRPHSDPLSRASPRIWADWDSFTARARTARSAAQGLNTQTLNGLRRTLPQLMQSCLGCHQSYRMPP